MINPIEFEDAYNSILLNGKRSPGKVTLNGHKREIDWDVKTVPGQKGATTTYKGEKPAEFTATFYLVWDPALGINDFEDWPEFLGIIYSSVRGKTPKALDIYHPDLVANGIVSVVMKSAGGVSHDGKGGQTIAIDFMEYRPPKPVGGAPKPKPKADPDAAALAELAALTKKYQETPWG